MNGFNFPPTELAVDLVEYFKRSGFRETTAWLLALINEQYLFYSELAKTPNERQATYKELANQCLYKLAAYGAGVIVPLPKK